MTPSSGSFLNSQSNDQQNAIPQNDQFSIEPTFNDDSENFSFISQIAMDVSHQKNFFSLSFFKTPCVNFLLPMKKTSPTPPVDCSNLSLETPLSHLHESILDTIKSFNDDEF